MNRVIKHLRLAREWTQEETARRVCDHVEAVTGHRPGIDGQWVSRLERGVITWPGREYRDGLRAVFGVADDDALGLFPSRTRRDHREDASKRRTFLSLSLAGIAPVHPPRRIGQGDVAELADRIYALEEWDRRSGGGRTRHLAVAELRHAVDATSASAVPTVRTGWCSAIANLGDLAGWSTLDAGAHEPARRLFRVGLEAAHEADDPQMICHVASGLARLEIDSGRAAEALTLLDMADGSAVPASARAMLAVVRAQAQALTGDRRAVMRGIGTAESLYGASDLPSDPRWMWYFTEHKLNGDIGHALYLLSGRTSGPVPELISRLRRSVDSLTSNRARSKAVYSARLATTLYRQRALDVADHYADLAKGLSESVRSARLDRALSEARRGRTWALKS